MGRRNAELLGIRYCGPAEKFVSCAETDPTVASNRTIGAMRRIVTSRTGCSQGNYGTNGGKLPEPLDSRSRFGCGFWLIGQGHGGAPFATVGEDDVEHEEDNCQVHQQERASDRGHAPEKLAYFERQQQGPRNQ